MTYPAWRPVKLGNSLKVINTQKQHLMTILICVFLKLSHLISHYPHLLSWVTLAKFENFSSGPRFLITINQAKLSINIIVIFFMTELERFSVKYNIFRHFLP